MAKEAHPEVEIVDLDALVRGVDKPGCELGLHRSHREEPVGDGPERLAQPMAVREAGEQERDDLRLRLLLGDERLDDVPQRRVERRARPALALDPLEVVVAVPEELADERLDLRLRALRKDPAVDDDLALRRDDVPLLRGADHRRRHRRPEQRLDNVPGERVDGPGGLDGVLRRRDLAANGQQEGGDLRADLRPVAEGAEALHHRSCLDEGVLRDARTGGVAAPAVDAEAVWRAHLLGRRARVEDAPAEEEPVAAALVHAVLGANGLRMCLAEPLEAEARADLLVGAGGEDQVAARLKALPRQRGERDRARNDLSLHVERAASPDLPVAQLAGPGVELPLGRVGENGVGVRQQHEPRPAPAARDPGDEVRPLRDLRQQLRLDAAVAQVLAKEFRGPCLVPGRVDRVDADQLLEELRRLLAQRDRRHYVSCFAASVSWLRASQSSGYIRRLIRPPRSSTGVPCVPTTLSPITRATTR